MDIHTGDIHTGDTHTGEGLLPTMPGCDVVELRQYTLVPGGRDILIGLFESDFLAGLAADGMTVGGLYLDRDDPDRLVWFRGFPDLDARAPALRAFYVDGPIWQAHRERANATMIDSDDVLLLRPVPLTAADARPPVGAELYVVTCTGPHRAELDDSVAAFGADLLSAHLRVPVAAWGTEPGPNDFPRLPVREEHAYVWAFASAEEGRVDALDALRAEVTRAHPRPDDLTWRTLRLEPAAITERHP